MCVKILPRNLNFKLYNLTLIGNYCVLLEYHKCVLLSLT